MLIVDVASSSLSQCVVLRSFAAGTLLVRSRALWTARAPPPKARMSRTRVLRHVIGTYAHALPGTKIEEGFASNFDGGVRSPFHDQPLGFSLEKFKMTPAEL